jgi:hypothetical protein
MDDAGIDLFRRWLGRDPRVQLEWTSRNSFRLTESIYSDEGLTVKTREFKLEEQK